MVAGGSLKLPGFGLPLGYMPDTGKCFPTIMGNIHGHGSKDWAADTLTIREICMLKAVEQLTNIPDWWIKVYDESITQKWRQEAVDMDWTLYREHADFTPTMSLAVCRPHLPHFQAL